MTTYTEIRLTGQRPVLIVQDDWLVIVSATNQVESEDGKRSRSLFVLIRKKCHAKPKRRYTRYIVYGSGPDENNRMVHAGYDLGFVCEWHDGRLIEGIQKVSEEIGDKSLAIECIQGLPPKRIKDDD